MENTRHEMYKYARKRLKHKKQVYQHFALFVISSLFIHLVNLIFDVDASSNWFTWLTTGWAILLVIHYIKVFIIESLIHKKLESTNTESFIPIRNNK